MEIHLRKIKFLIYERSLFKNYLKKFLQPSEGFAGNFCLEIFYQGIIFILQHI